MLTSWKKFSLGLLIMALVSSTSIYGAEPGMEAALGLPIGQNLVGPLVPDEDDGELEPDPDPLVQSQHSMAEPDLVLTVRSMEGPCLVADVFELWPAILQILFEGGVESLELGLPECMLRLEAVAR